MKSQTLHNNLVGTSDKLLGLFDPVIQADGTISAADVRKIRSSIKAMASINNKENCDIPVIDINPDVIVKHIGLISRISSGLLECSPELQENALLMAQQANDTDKSTKQERLWAALTLVDILTPEVT